jgi:hypothetical protein
MQHASNENAPSSAAENSDVESDERIEQSDDDGSQRPSPSLYRQQPADENADDSQDDDGEDNQSDYGSLPELCDSENEDEEYYQRSESTPAAHSASAVSHESLLKKFSELTRHLGRAEPEAFSHVP